MTKINKPEVNRPQVKHTPKGKVSVSCSLELYERIERAARIDARSVSNWMLCAAKEKLDSLKEN